MCDNSPLPTLSPLANLTPTGTQPEARMDERKQSDALARNERYLREAIEALAFCPYAAPARLEGASLRRVYEGTLPSAPNDALHEIMDAIASPGGPDVAQLIFPDETDDPRDWDRRGKALVRAMHDQRGASVVGVAPLHPHAPYKAHSPRAMVPLFRRAPDPTLQWIALDALDRVRAGRPRGEVLLPRDPDEARELLARLQKPSLADAIANANYERASAMGLAAVEALFASFRAGGATPRHDDDPT